MRRQNPLRPPLPGAGGPGQEALPEKNAGYDCFFGVDLDAIQVCRRARGRQGHALREALEQVFLDRSVLVGARNQAPLALKWRHMIPASRLRHVAIPKTWKFELANICRAGPFLAGNICKVIPAMNVGHDGVLIND
jgi:hypothetical protein